MFHVGSILSIGLRLAKEHYGIFLPAVLTVLVLNVPIWLLNEIFPFESMYLENTGLGDVVGLLYQPMLTVGLSYLGLRAYRKQAVVFGDLFIGFSQYWRMFWVNLLFWFLYSLGVFLALFDPFVLLFNDDSGIEFAFSVAWVVVVTTCLTIFLARLSFVWILTLVTRSPVLTSVQQSLRATRRVWGRMFILWGVMFLLAVTSAVLLVLPFFFVFLPFMVGVIGVVSGMLLEELGDDSDQNDKLSVHSENPVSPNPIQ